MWCESCYDFTFLYQPNCLYAATIKNSKSKSVYLESSQLLQLSGALLAAIIMFVAAYAAPLRVSVAILLMLIPFQPVATSYGSANVVMTFVLAGALMVRGRLQYVPMLGIILAVIFAYLVSISQLPRSLYVLHGIEIIALVSGFLVFTLAYNLAREVEDHRSVINLLISANVLAALYCVVQFTVSPGESLELFGVKELSLNENRGEGDARLVGPFGTPGLTAAYFMWMTLILLYEVLHSQGRRRVLISILIVTNVTMLIATANRGSFIVLLAGLLGFLFLFRARLGFTRILGVLVGSTIILVGTTAFVATYTEFGQMSDRLARTMETRDGLPATRAASWPVAWKNVQQKPWLGHGPRIMGQHERRFRHVPPEQLVSQYPHSLYLHLLVTVGIVGTLCMLFFIISVLWRIRQGVKTGHFRSEYEKGWLLVGLILVVAFLVDELKIEFLRNTSVDYAHFVFAVFGIFLGWADKARRQAIVTEPVPTSERSVSSGAQPYAVSHMKND